MASLKSFLSGVAPTLEVTPAALYERQRALVSLGLLTPIEGRGRGSGVPFTAENFAAVLISLLATDSLTEVDERVVALIKAPPVLVGRTAHNPAVWKKAGSPTFCTAVGAVLAATPMPWPMTDKGPVLAIRVTRYFRGQLVTSPSGANPTEYEIDPRSPFAQRYRPPVLITAEIESGVLDLLEAFTKGALSLSEEDDDE